MCFLKYEGRNQNDYNSSSHQQAFGRHLLQSCGISVFFVEVLVIIAHGVFVGHYASPPIRDREGAMWRPR